jgi:hypothetical protein
VGLCEFARENGTYFRVYDFGEFGFLRSNDIISLKFFPSAEKFTVSQSLKIEEKFSHSEEKSLSKVSSLLVRDGGSKPPPYEEMENT